MVLICSTPGTYSSNKKFPGYPKFQMQFGMRGIHNVMQETWRSSLTNSVFLACRPQETVPTNQQADHAQPRDPTTTLSAPRSNVPLNPEQSAPPATVQVGKMSPQRSEQRPPLCPTPRNAVAVHSASLLGKGKMVWKGAEPLSSLLHQRLWQCLWTDEDSHLSQVWKITEPPLHLVTSHSTPSSPPYVRHNLLDHPSCNSYHL